MTHTQSPSAMLDQRRTFLTNSALGLGSVALSTLLNSEAAAGERAMALRDSHFPPRAKNVIFLFMAGGPSQLELFTPKPVLNQYHGQTPPASMTEGRRFAFLPADAKLLGSNRHFGRWGDCGMDLSIIERSSMMSVGCAVWRQTFSITDRLNYS